MSKFKANKGIKFSRKYIQRGNHALLKLKDTVATTDAEHAMLDEMRTKVYSAVEALSYFMFIEDYDSLRELGKEIKQFAKEKWTDYVNPAIWTKEEHEYLQKQFNVKIDFKDFNLDFDVDKFTHVDFFKEQGQIDVKYYALTYCPYMDGYNDPMASNYFDPENTDTARKALNALITRVNRDIEMNQTYIQRQKEKYAKI